MIPEPVRGELPAPDGVTLSTALWLPEGPPQAVVFLVHGHAEHLGRYDGVVAALLAEGYVVAGQDHRGHGRSSGERALVMRFDDFVDDYRLLALQVQARFAGIPVAMIGHSMGGLIAAHYALRYQHDLSALVLSGAAFVIDEGVPSIVRNVMHLFARIFPKVPVPRNQSDVLSTDPAVGDAFAADPLNYHDKARLRTASEMVRAGADAIERAPTLTIPLLAMHGLADTLTSPHGTERFYERAGSEDKTLELWSGLKHEIFNEVDGEDVIAFTRAWLAERM